ILEEASLTLAEEEQLIASQAAVLAQAQEVAQTEKARLEEEERKRAEEERKRQEAARQAAQESKPAATAQAASGGGSSNPPTSVSSSGYIWPASGRISSGFGPRIHPITGEVGKMHNGLDIAAPSGTPVSSVAAGVVATAGWMGGYGNTVMISHGSTTTLYAHLSSISVSAGQSVSRGQTIGAVGSTGNSTGPHLHFEVHPGGYSNPANPRNYLP